MRIEAVWESLRGLLVCHTQCSGQSEAKAKCQRCISNYFGAVEAVDGCWLADSRDGWMRIIDATPDVGPSVVQSSGAVGVSNVQWRIQGGSENGPYLTIFGYWYEWEYASRLRLRAIFVAKTKTKMKIIITCCLFAENENEIFLNWRKL